MCCTVSMLQLGQGKNDVPLNFSGRFCCSSKNKGSRCEDGWSVETAQSNVSSNVEIIVDIKERGKCQLSLGKSGKRIERGNNAIKVRHWWREDFIKNNNGHDWLAQMPEDRSFFYKYGLMILAFRMQSEQFFGVMNERKQFLQNQQWLRYYSKDLRKT